MTNYDQILQELKTELFQSITFLEYSYNKVRSKQSTAIESMDPELLETFEALVSRFSRTTDIFIAKYLRSVAEKDDPAFRGGLRDWVNYAEKKGLINSASQWMEIRELRNKISHEYAAKDLALIFKQVLDNTHTVLDIRKVIK
jgi:hypothetical protein